MKLLSLTLINFKGVKHFHLDLDGGDVSIYGNNGTGKTTIGDAYSWLVRGKDMANRSDFAVKTLDVHGEPLPGLNHSVTAKIDVAGKIIELKKTHREVWTKKRGAPVATLSGNTIDHEIDGVPVKKSEYDEKIKEIIPDETLFLLLSNPRYFNDELHWQQRRALIMEVCGGDVDADDVIDSNDSLAGLRDILNGRTIDDHRKIVQGRQQKINEEMEQIPVRIDEVDRSLPDITGLEKPVLQNAVEMKQNHRREKQQERARIESGGEIAEKRKQLREIESDIQSIINRVLEKETELVQEQRQKLNPILTAIHDLEYNVIRKFNRKIENNVIEIDQLTGELDVLRHKWKSINGRTFEFEEDETCPTCGQPLPAGQIIAVREKAYNDFNQKKADDLARNVESGKTKRANVERLTGENIDLKTEFQTAETKMVELVAKRDEITCRIESIKSHSTNAIENDREFVVKTEQKRSLENTINLLADGLLAGPLADIDEIINGIDVEIASLEKQLADIDSFDRGQKRIDDLKKRERELATEFEKNQSQIYMMDEFVKTKVAMMDERINHHFKMARFKLFTVQMNGGLEECCETLGDGVPWSAGLNNGKQLNVGIDIINTLAGHYNITSPIFADNAESVTELIPTESQLIRLVVSKPDNKLRIEFDGKEVS